MFKCKNGKTLGYYLKILQEQYEKEHPDWESPKPEPKKPVDTGGVFKIKKED